MMTPILSVITATHNDGLYIQEAINSILEQTFSDFEYLIVDDASTDATLSILTRFKDKRLSIIHNDQKMGPGAARNRALEEATGEYVAVMDGDDISHPERFQMQMDYLVTHPNIIYLGTGVRMISKEDGQFIRDEIKPLTDGAARWTLLHKSPIFHPTSIGRRDLINKAGNYAEDLPRCQDVDLMRRISSSGELGNMPDILYTYRTRTGSAQNKVVEFGKPYVQRVHSTYISGLLEGRFDPDIIKFLWSVRYPIHNDFPSHNHDDIIVSAISALFALYHEFLKGYNLSAEEKAFIQKDLLIWISKVASKSENYTMLLDNLLKPENLTNLRRSNSLIKASLKSFFKK